MKYLILLFLSVNVLANSFEMKNFWDSDFPDSIDLFIYEQTHKKCLRADYVDSIIAYDEENFSSHHIYTADYSMYGDVAQGFIIVKQDLYGKLELLNLDCPRP